MKTFPLSGSSSPCISRHGQPPDHGGFLLSFTLSAISHSLRLCADRIQHIQICMVFDRMNSATYLATQLAKTFNRSLQERSVALGFLPGQFPVLLELWNGDGLTQKELLDRLDVEQATLANTLSRMERDGLIERKVHPTDRRKQVINLTEKANLMREPAIAAALEADDVLFAGFRQFERELLMEYLRRVIENASKD